MNLPLAPTIGLALICSASACDKSSDSGPNASPAEPSADSPSRPAPLGSSSAGDTSSPAETDTASPEAPAPAWTPIEEWSDFTEEDLGFRVRLPANPAARTTPVSGAGFVAQAKSYTVEDGALNLSVSVTELPRPILRSLSPDEALQAAKDRFVQDAKASVREAREISLGKTPGREVEMEATGGGYDLQIAVRFYYARPFLYQLFAGAEAKSDISEPKRAFFSSFEITEAKGSLMERGR